MSPTVPPLPSRSALVLVSWWDELLSVYHDVELCAPAGIAVAISEARAVSLQLMSMQNRTGCLTPLPNDRLDLLKWRPFVDDLTCGVCAAAFDLSFPRSVLRDPVNLVAERPVLSSRREWRFG